MIYDIDFTDSAMLDIVKHRKSGDKVVLRKIEKLLNELREHPRTGT
jgi:toxin YoeB